ncbi:MAG TPA: hypothetical protein VF756_03415 [Thermoanaerobaculia bacterium]
MHDFDSLLATARRHEATHPGIKPFREVLEEACARAVSARRLRDTLDASKMEATHQLNLAFDESHEAAIRLRNFAKGVLGPRSEALADFGVKPLRKRGPKSAP